jgi:hypothetical protein
MAPEHNDFLLFEVVDFMLERNLTSVASELLKYVQQLGEEKYQLEFSRVKNQEG